MPRPTKHPVVYEELSYKIIGLGFAVQKELGNIHTEIVYQKSFEIALKNQEIPFEREKRLPVIFQGKNVGLYVPDFVIDDKIIVEIKALEMLPYKASVQLSYYLKTTGYRVGILLNFGSRRLQVRRRIYG
ncbi:GxxExxY protein [Candidatus Gottesmanbacteria bacterium]|nr:GxxExxY protein [Candidatus Gottesmanbacteria bacterium]